MCVNCCKGRKDYLECKLELLKLKIAKMKREQEENLRKQQDAVHSNCDQSNDVSVSAVPAMNDIDVQ